MQVDRLSDISGAGGFSADRDRQNDRPSAFCTDRLSVHMDDDNKNKNSNNNDDTAATTIDFVSLVPKASSFES